jgi:hypothetical protein
LFFLVVDGEGEEILARLRRLVGRRGDENGAFAVSDQYGAVRLSCQPAGFDDQLLAGPDELFTRNIKHLVFLSAPLQTVG